MALGHAALAVTVNSETQLKFKRRSSSSKRTCKEDAIDGPSRPPFRIHNHFEGSGLLCTKRGICESMQALFLPQNRDPFGAVPLTFIVREGTSDPQFQLWRQSYDAFQAEAGQCIWIVKPGEWGNRGCGIKIYNNPEDVASRIASKAKVWAIQKYIERPLLIHKRKFDIRAYCLVIQEPSRGPLRAFSYRDAYLRTTSSQYTIKNFDPMVHLNNDAVQKNGEDYGKFESANKMSLDEFQKYLDENHAKAKVNVREQVFPRIQALMADAVHSVAEKLNPRGLDYCFEVYGFDFMMDANYRVWLIECNANPCLDLCSAYLSHVIPNMLEHAMRLTVDRFASGNALPQSSPDMNYGGEAGTKWDLIFDSSQCRSLSCSWVEDLPAEGADAAVAPLMLGREILCRKKIGRAHV